jgi:hypothetical protein
VEILHNWQNFFILAGGASVTLLGLIFVAVSLGPDLNSPTLNTDVQIFVDPILLYYSTVFIVAAVGVAPVETPAALGVLMGLAAVPSFWYSIQVVVNMKNHPNRQKFGKDHWLWHGLIPISSAVAIFVGTALTLTGNMGTALVFNAVAMLALMFTATRNTWELAMWIARSRSGLK